MDVKKTICPPHYDPELEYDRFFPTFSRRSPLLMQREKNERPADITTFRQPKREPKS